MIRRDDIQQLPTEPGVYLMKDDQGEILYIGKAVNIQARVRSHFSGGRENRGFYSRVSWLDFVITQNEIEALLLENLLIKEHLPRYNVRLKDDKRYPYLKLSLEEKFPRLYTTRQNPGKGEAKKTGETGARYFGPYPQVGEARAILQTLQEIFPLRTCKIPSHELRLPRPCIQYEMHRCLAPCVESLCSAAEYREVALRVKKFLEGDHRAVAQHLEDRMQQAADSMSFEKAAIYRDALKALRVFSQGQVMTLIEEDSEDYLGYAVVGNVSCVVVMRRRGGSIRGSEHYFLDIEEELPADEVLSAFVTQHYESSPDIPRRIICPVEPDSSETLEAWLTSLLTKKVEIRIPHRGPRLRLMELARKNAEYRAAEQYRKIHGGRQKIRDEVIRLGVELNLRVVPFRIEGFDISHHHGEEAVASMVVFENGIPKKSDYRKFKIKSGVGGDDFRSMKEVIKRRFQHQDEEFGRWPDLVLIDGGPVQLQFALRTLEEVSSEQGLQHAERIRSQQLVSLAKREEEIFLIGQENPVVLQSDNPGLKLLQQVRDESHRFALGFHRQRKSKNRQTSILEDIPGIGPSRMESLLTRFGSLEKIASLSVADISQVPGISEKIAEQIIATCKKKTESIRIKSE